MTDRPGSAGSSSSARLDELGTHDHAAPPFPATPAVDTRGPQAPRRAGGVLAHAGRSAHQRPSTTFFQRQNDFFTQWGGPNTENTYRHARVDPAASPTASDGRMNSCQDFILAIRAGFPAPAEPGDGSWRSPRRERRHPREGDEFELLLGGPPSDDPHHIHLPDEAIIVLDPRVLLRLAHTVRPATMTIECLDADGPPGRVLTAPSSSFAQLEEAATHGRGLDAVLEQVHDRLPRPPEAHATRSTPVPGTRAASTPRRGTSSASTTSRPTRR